MRHSLKRTVLLGCMAIAMGVLLSCGGGGGGSNNPPTTVTVSVGDNFFDPASVTVTAGSTIIWKNMGTHDHTATSGSPGARSNLFDSGALNPNQSFQHTFSSAGNFAYFCTVHPEMSGMIIVQAPSSGGGGYNPSGIH
jgi:plastocyanin